MSWIVAGPGSAESQVIVADLATVDWDFSQACQRGWIKYPVLYDVSGQSLCFRMRDNAQARASNGCAFVNRTQWFAPFSDTFQTFFPLFARCHWVSIGQPNWGATTRWSGGGRTLTASFRCGRGAVPHVCDCCIYGWDASLMFLSTASIRPVSPSILAVLSACCLQASHHALRGL